MLSEKSKQRSLLNFESIDLKEIIMVLNISYDLGKRLLG